MRNINNEIGGNLQRIRIARGLTLDNVCQELEEFDCKMSPPMLSKIENGKQRIYADQLIYLCKVYGTSLSGVSASDKNDIDDAIANAIKTEPIDIKRTVLWCITEWHGNTTALWKFLGLYVSMPPRIRHMIAGMGISTYNYAKQTNQVNKSAPSVDIVYLTKEYRRLLNE